jgi:hypothetical protein
LPLTIPGVVTVLVRAAVLTLVLLYSGAPAFCRDIEAPTLPGKWTNTEPPINLIHIELGEINRLGEAVGYHHRPNGLDPPGARILRIAQPPDAKGIYRARVALRDPATEAWVQKKAASTFFPDAMSPSEVIAAILTAFRHGQTGNSGQFVGPSGSGFAIEGWYQNGRINAVYPLRGP